MKKVNIDTPKPNASKIKENLHHKAPQKTEEVNTVKPFHVMQDLSRYIDVRSEYHACSLMCALLSRSHHPCQPLSSELEPGVY